MTTFLLLVIKRKKKAKKRAEFTQAAVDIEQYKKLKNQLKMYVCEAKLLYLQELLRRSRRDPQFSAQL